MSTFTDDCPWPKDDDRLFEKEGEGDCAERAGSKPLDEILESLQPDLDYRYREGYYDAGVRLAANVGDQSGLIFPMLFCFRHFVELSLKSLIETYAGLVDVTLSKELLHQHELAKLWTEARRLIEAAESGAGEGDATLDNVERCVRELHEADKRSTLFRYATDETGDSVEARLPKTEIGQFLKTMENIESFFEACRAQAEVWQEWKNEMETEYRSDEPGW